MADSPLHAKPPHNCYGCRYFYITYEQARPYACRKFGFKGPQMPAVTVFATTGMKCAFRQAGNRPLKTGKASPGQRSGR